jgi:hypothetical protein
LSDHPFKSNDTSNLRLLKVNSCSHLARAGEKLGLRGATETENKDFLGHFSSTPGPSRIYFKSGLFLAGSPQNFMKKFAKRAGSGWSHIHTMGAEEKLLILNGKHDFFKIHYFLRVSGSH